MERERLGGSLNLRGRAITLLVLLCAGLLAWGVLQTFQPSAPLRRVPLQAPARQEPGDRPLPTLDPEPLS
jgi:hypothetical protein